MRGGHFVHQKLENLAKLCPFFSSKSELEEARKKRGKLKIQRENPKGVVGFSPRNPRKSLKNFWNPFLAKWPVVRKKEKGREK